MLGQPVYFLTPDVVGFELTGQLREGVTATDLVLTVTEILRKREGGRQVRRVLRRRHAHGLALPDRATIGQHGARVRRDDGLLPGRREDHRVLRGHRPHEGRDRGLRGLLQGAGACSACRAPGEIDYTQGRRASTWARSRRAWPARSGRRTASSSATSRTQFAALFSKPPTENGFNQPAGAAADAPPGARRRRAQRRRRRREDPAHARGAAGRAAPGRARWSANKPTLAAAHARGRAGDSRARRHDDRQRRRADRRHHLLHQHLATRACCSPPACWRRRRSRPG